MDTDPSMVGDIVAEPMYDVQVIERAAGRPDLKQTTEGSGKPVAAFLRAYAEQISPTTPVKRHSSR